ANVLDPVGTRAWSAHVFLVYGPGPRQGMVDHRDLVMQNIRIVLVEMDSLLEDRLIVGMHRQAAGVEDARTFEVARLDLEHVVAAVAVLVDPLPDRVTLIRRLDLLGPVAPVREDATMMIDVADQ